MTTLSTIDPGALAAAMEGGLAHHRAGRLSEAEAIYRRVLSATPGHPGALHLLGVIAHETGHDDAAVELIEKAIAGAPDTADFHNNLGTVFRQLGRRDDAVAAYRRAVACKPDYPEAWNSLGTAYRELGLIDEAVAAYRRALDNDPDYIPARNNLGNVLQDQGNLSGAAEAYSRILALQPDYAQAHNNLGVALKDQGLAEEAMAAHRRALELDPAYVAAHCNLNLALHYRETLGPAAILAEHRRWAERHAAPLRASIRPHRNDRSPDRPLRVGYLSPDFYGHSVAFFIASLLTAHNRSRVTAVCYADGPRRDIFSDSLKALADEWREIHGQGDEAVAALIRADRIDILVDLAGHTARNRLLVFARKPAPVQLTAIGYCATTGLDTMDYRLTDGTADPGGQDAYHSESLVRLPRCFLCYTPIEEAAAPAPPPARTAGHVTFGSFNNLAKVQPEVLAAWAEVLHAVPGSRLLLKARALGDEAVRERLAGQLAALGIDGSRIALRGTIPSTLEHLALYGTVDIALDPFPYNGTTTTCEALWMGVPVVTLAGRVHAGRVGASLLAAVGLDELVAATPKDYVALAAGLAGDLGRLAALRAGLRPRMAGSALCDKASYARAVEDAYRTMWRRWCAGSG